MTNTDSLYVAMNDFRKAQIASRETYLQKKRNLDRYKGSEGYSSDLQKIRKERDDANAAARATCKEKVDLIFKCMMNANRKRAATPPTEEQLRLLNAASMMKKPSKLMLDSIANSMNGNAVGLAVLDDIAKAAWADDPNALNRFTPNYAAMADKEMSVPDAEEAIRSLANTCSRIMNGSGANHIREMGAEHNRKMYGMQYDPDDFEQEKEYSTERDFYNRELSSGSYETFAAAVNG